MKATNSCEDMELLLTRTAIHSGYPTQLGFHISGHHYD